MRSFSLEVKQGEVWLHKGSYTNLDAACEAQRRRYPNWTYRVINYETGAILAEPEADEYGFENSINTINFVEQEARRISTSEGWHRRFSEERERRTLRFERERELQRQLAEQRTRIIPERRLPPPQLPKKRKPHIRWWVDGF